MNPTISEAARRAVDKIFQQTCGREEAAAIIQSALDSAHPAPTWGDAELTVMANMAAALTEIDRQTQRVNGGRDDAYSQVGTAALWQAKKSLAEYLEWKRKPKLRPEHSESHPALKEGSTPETDAVYEIMHGNVLRANELKALYKVARSLELRLSEAKRHLKTANELLRRALGNRRQLEGEAAFLFTPEFENEIRTHLNQQSK